MASPASRKFLPTDMEGVWKNTVGSTMIIELSPREKEEESTKLVGTYSSGVETSPGVVGTLYPLRGVVKDIGENGVLVSWSVVWTGKKSVTTWVGQSMKDGGGTMRIFSTWVLRSLDPIARWQANHINQDSFWKLDEKINFQPSIVEEVGMNEGLVGCWDSLENDLFRISSAKKTGKLEGEHLGLLHPELGGPEARGELVGVTESGDDFVTLGFSAFEQRQVKGWTGFIYNNPEGLERPVMETAWLSHEYCASFYLPREKVRFGMDNYKRQPLLTTPPKAAATAEEMDTKN